MEDTTQFEDDELEDTEEEDDLSDIDEDTKARFDKYTARQQQEYDARVTKLQESLGTVGLGVSDDGQISIRNLQTVQSYFAPIASNQSSRANTDFKTLDTDEDDEWADPVIDTDRYEKKLSKVIEKATEPYKQQIESLKQALVEDKIEQAVNRVEDAVNKYAPLYAEILEHPQFETTFREVLASMPMENWRDARSLAKLVGMLGVDLSPVEKRQKQQSQQKVSPQEQVRSDFNRKQLGQIAPSKGAASKTSMDYDDVDRILAERFGIPLEQAKALGSKSDPDNGITPERLYRESRLANGKRR